MGPLFPDDGAPNRPAATGRGTRPSTDLPAAGGPNVGPTLQSWVLTLPVEGSMPSGPTSYQDDGSVGVAVKS